MLANIACMKQLEYARPETLIPPHLALNNNFNLTKTYNPVKTAFLAVVIAPVPFFI